MNSEIIVYITTLICTFCLFYIPIKKYGLTCDLLTNILYIIVIIYCLTKLVPEIKMLFILPYFMYSNIFDYIKTGKLLPLGCIRQNDGSVICM